MCTSTEDVYKNAAVDCLEMSIKADGPLIIGADCGLEEATVWCTDNYVIIVSSKSKGNF